MHPMPHCDLGISDSYPSSASNLRFEQKCSTRCSYNNLAADVSRTAKVNLYFVPKTQDIRNSELSG
jgi:hypothetical protein